MKKSIAITVISILTVAVIALGVLYYLNDKGKTETINNLSAEISEKTAKIDELTESLADQAAETVLTSQKLNEEMNVLKNELKTKEKEMAEISAYAQENLDKISELRKSNRDLKKQVKELTEKVEKLEGESGKE